MIRINWDDDNPPTNLRILKLENFNKFVISVPPEYNDGNILLEPHLYKQALLNLHYLHEDNLFSIEEFKKEIEYSFIDKIVYSLINKKICVFVVGDDNKYLAMTDYGISIYEEKNFEGFEEDEILYLEFFMENKKILNFNKIEFIEEEEEE